MKKFIISLLFLCSPVTAEEFRHFSDWSAAEKTEFISYLGLTIIDYKQTKWALEQRHSDGSHVYYEANPVFGERPDLNLVLVAQLISVGTYYYMVGHSYDTKYRAFSMGVRLAVVINNDRVGARITKVF